MFDVLKEHCAQKGSITFWVKVRPNASGTKATSTLDDGTVKIDIAAAPEKGKANLELIKYLAEEFGVPRSHIEILCGEAAKGKQIRVVWPS
jgi:uncharacterized protein (TIGR00251 family)